MTDLPRPCPLCGITEATVFLATSRCSNGGQPYHIVECCNCRLRYTRPVPTIEELTALYSQEYYVQNSSRLLSGDFLRIIFQQSVFWQHLRAFLGRRPGRILDIGCGNGDFLATLKRRGWEVYGTEFSAAACELARRKGIAVHHGDLRSARFPAKFFDVVTLWHVLEHLPEPSVELAEVRRILRDDGLLVIEVPNSASSTLRRCGEKWYHLDVPRHLEHFSASTLQTLLHQSRFTPVYRQNFHHWDITSTIYSYMKLWGVSQHLRIDHFSTNYKRAPLLSKLLFLALGLLTGAICLPYWLTTTVVSGTSETVTITARKAAG